MAVKKRRGRPRKQFLEKRARNQRVRVLAGVLMSIGAILFFLALFMYKNNPMKQTDQLLPPIQTTAAPKPQTTLSAKNSDVLTSGDKKKDKTAQSKENQLEITTLSNTSSH